MTTDHITPVIGSAEPVRIVGCKCGSRAVLLAFATADPFYACGRCLRTQRFDPSDRGSWEFIPPQQTGKTSKVDNA